MRTSYVRHLFLVWGIVLREFWALLKKLFRFGFLKFPNTSTVTICAVFRSIHVVNPPKAFHCAWQNCPFLASRFSDGKIGDFITPMVGSFKTHTAARFCQRMMGPAPVGLHSEDPTGAELSNISIYAGWWFGCHVLLSQILGIIIPIDFHIFQRGSDHQPVWYFIILNMLNC